MGRWRGVDFNAALTFHYILFCMNFKEFDFKLITSSKAVHIESVFYFHLAIFDAILIDDLFPADVAGFWAFGSVH